MIKNNRHTFSYLIILVLWGLWAFLPKLAVRTIRPPTAVAAEVTASLSIAIAFLILKALVHKDHFSYKINRSKIKGGVAAILAGIFGYSGIFTYIIAIQNIDVHLAAVVSGLYPSITVLLGVTILKERLSWNHWLGIVLSLISIAFISGV